MTAEQLRQQLYREPFQPFRVRISDGRAFEIHDPYLHLVGESVFVVGIPAPDEPRFYDRQVWVPLNMVEGVEPLPAAAQVS